MYVRIRPDTMVFRDTCPNPLQCRGRKQVGGILSNTYAWTKATPTKHTTHRHDLCNSTYIPKIKVFVLLSIPHVFLVNSDTSRMLSSAFVSANTLSTEVKRACVQRESTRTITCHMALCALTNCNYYAPFCIYGP